jgi:hypothetical protein
MRVVYNRLQQLLCPSIAYQQTFTDITSHNSRRFTPGFSLVIGLAPTQRLAKYINISEQLRKTGRVNLVIFWQKTIPAYEQRLCDFVFFKEQVCAAV